MKLSILLAGLLLTINAYGSNWQEHWIQAVECCENKDYLSAEKEFTLAISNLENDQDETHPHVYIDRARLYVLQDRYTEALPDLNKGLSSDYLIGNDRIRGLVTRISTCFNLGMNDQALKDYDDFKLIYPNFPKVEFTQERVIIRNVPDSKCYRRLAKKFLVNSRICEKETDIVELDSGIIIAPRNQCGCCNKKNPVVGSSAQDCSWWCDKSALAGFTWCSRVFKNWQCNVACITAVELFKDGCHWCCKEGNYYKRCVEPFSEIVAYMDDSCDSYWD